jgi:hypothetical protein
MSPRSNRMLGKTASIRAASVATLRGEGRVVLGSCSTSIEAAVLDGRAEATREDFASPGETSHVVVVSSDGRTGGATPMTPGWNRLLPKSSPVRVASASTLVEAAFVVVDASSTATGDTSVEDEAETTREGAASTETKGAPFEEKAAVPEENVASVRVTAAVPSTIVAPLRVGSALSLQKAASRTIEASFSLVEAASTDDRSTVVEENVDALRVTADFRAPADDFSPVADDFLAPAVEATRINDEPSCPRPAPHTAAAPTAPPAHPPSRR